MRTERAIRPMLLLEPLARRFFVGEHFDRLHECHALAV